MTKTKNTTYQLPIVESDVIEFKTSFNEDVIETLVAFSNAKGGTVYVGVSDAGKPQGITIGTERFDYPLDAIREIVINMVVHRDYRDSSASIIKIFDNRIEFYNPGKLYGGITVQDLLSGSYISRARNKLIARAFKEADIIERYGSGIIRVRKICKEYGVKEPDFNEISNGFQVILYNEKIVDEKDVTDRVPDRVPDTLTDYQKSIIKFILENNTISMNELSIKVGISKRKILDNINKLKEMNLLKREGNNKKGFWRVLNIEKKGNH